MGRQNESVWEDVVKLTTTWQHQGMDAAPQHTTRLLPWRWAPRATMGKQQLWSVSMCACTCVFKWVCKRLWTQYVLLWYYEKYGKSWYACACVRVWMCMYAHVCACAYTDAHASVHAYLCCGRGCRCWNLRSRWRSAPQEDCSSPSHHRNTITIATREGRKRHGKSEWEIQSLNCFSLSLKKPVVSKYFFENAKIHPQQVAVHMCTRAHSENTHTNSNTHALNSQTHTIHTSEHWEIIFHLVL